VESAPGFQAIIAAAARKKRIQPAFRLRNIFFAIIIGWSIMDLGGCQGYTQTTRFLNRKGRKERKDREIFTTEYTESTENTENGGNPGSKLRGSELCSLPREENPEAENMFSDPDSPRGGLGISDPGPPEFTYGIPALCALCVLCGSKSLPRQLEPVKRLSRRLL